MSTENEYERRASSTTMTERGATALLGLAQDDFACPVCMSLFRDPFVTDCGHSFCFQCITTHLSNKKSCPCCSTYVTADKIHPNFVLHKAVDKVSKASVVRRLTPPEMVVQLITEDRAHLKLEDVNKLLHLLGERKRLLEQQDAESNLQLLLHFLRHSRQEKAKQLLGLQSELKLLEADIQQVGGHKVAAASLAAAEPQQLPSPSMQEAAAAACANGTTLHASSAQTSSAASQSLSLPLSNGLLPQVAALPASEAIPAASLAAEQAAGAAAAGSLPNSLPMLASSGQLVSPAAAASLLLPPSQQQAVLAPCTAAGSMSRASNGYLMITNPYLPQPVTRSSSARLARGASEGTNTSAAMTASAAATPALPVAPPTQLGANGAMHIHPRHLAFQHFQQQQAALQQRQQQPVNAHGLASAHSLDSTDGDALDRMDRAASLASAQSDASRTRRRRLLSQFDDLQQCYLRLRNPKKRSAQPWVQSHQPALKEQPAKRVKQEPEMGLQGPSDSASSDPLSGAHPTGPSPAGHLHEQQPTGPSPAGHLHQQQPTGPSPAGHLHQQQFNGVDSADPQHGLPNRNMAPPAPVKTGKPLTGNGAALPGAAPASDHVGSGYGVLPSLVVTTAPGLEPGQGAGAEGKPQPAVPDQQHADVVGPADEEGLAEFSRMLSVFTHCARLKVTAQLPRTSNAHCSNILSSIEFDRDGEIFATAGVSKRISMYDYSAVMACPNAETHTPSQELVTRSKLSCLSWNKYLRTYLASSDYEGVVHVWDIATGQNVVEYEAHEKRIWSVDFCQSDPKLLMSGSDDGMVKIWSSNQGGSVAEIDIKANVCCAKYNPESTYKVAVGAADHTVHTYDLRKADKAVHVFRGHRKAVSYVRYLNGNELVSASTDSTLRLWDTQACVNTRVFNGHSNEKNFVGLSLVDDFVACGSETNEVFVYYKAMSKPVCRRLFSTPAEVARHAHNQDPSQFISAVCWKPDSQVLLSANSQGTIKIMQVTA